MNDRDWEVEGVFAWRVRQERERRGWSQDRLARELAAKTGRELHSTAVTRLEKGERPTRLAEAEALAGALEVPLGKLLVSPDRFGEMRIIEAVERMRSAQRGVAEARDEYAYWASEARALVASAETVWPRLYLRDAIRRSYQVSEDEAERLTAKLLDAEDEHGEHPEAS